jgi:hypothetical protein
MAAEDRTRMNRTGAAVAPDLAVEMVAAVEEFPPSSPGDGRGIAAVRAVYAQESTPINMDQPGEVDQPPMLMDKLGERLAFERAGTRLYEALLSKHEAYGGFEGGPSQEDIIQILGEELEHFHLLVETVVALGGDPTELTPSANLHLTASHGVGQVLVDPRTSVLQSLEAIAVAELADNEGWECLAALARLAGQSELAGRFDEAHSTEQEHLEKVRSWLAVGQGRPAAEGERVDAAEAERIPPKREARRTKPKTTRRRAS